MVRKLSFDFYIKNSLVHGLSPFSNKLAMKFWQNCTCSRASVNECIKNGSIESFRLSSFRIIFVFYDCWRIILYVSCLLIAIVQTY